MPIEAIGQSDDIESIVSSNSGESSPERSLGDQVDRLVIEVFGSTVNTDDDLHSISQMTVQ